MPADYQEFHSKDVVQVPLKTDSRSIAERHSSNLNQLLESYWRDMALKGDGADLKKFNDMVKRTRICGFQYRSMEDIVTQATPVEFINRINAADKMISEKDIQSILGIGEKPYITLEAAQEIYFEHEAGNLVDRSDNQIRHWKNQRKRSVKNFISVIGDIPLDGITREDILRYRNWWVSRIQS